MGGLHLMLLKRFMEGWVKMSARAGDDFATNLWSDAFYFRVMHALPTERTGEAVRRAGRKNP